MQLLLKNSIIVCLMGMLINKIDSIPNLTKIKLHTKNLILKTALYLNCCCVKQNIRTHLYNVIAKQC